MQYEEKYDYFGVILFGMWRSCQQDVFLPASSGSFGRGQQTYVSSIANDIHMMI